MGRPRKPSALLEYQETLEKRQKNRADMDLTIPLQSIEPPSSLTNNRAIEAFRDITGSLCALKILSVQDLPNLEIMFITLQEIYIAQEELTQLRSKKLTDKSRALIEQKNKTLMRSIKVFQSLSAQFAMTPGSRTHFVFEMSEAKNNTKDIIEDIIECQIPE